MGRLVTRLVLVGLFAAAMAVGLWLVRPRGEGTELGGVATEGRSTPGSAPGEPAPLPALPGAAPGVAASGMDGGKNAKQPMATGTGPSTPSDESGGVQIRLSGSARDAEGRAADGAVLHFTAWTAQVTPDGSHETSLEHAEMTADAGGRFSADVAVPTPSPEGSSAVHGVTVDVVGGGYVRAGEKLKLPAKSVAGVTVTVRRLPGVRVQILDAGTRAAVAGVQMAGCQSRADGDWWVFWADGGAHEVLVLVSAPGYVTTRPVLQFPDSGTVTRGEPIVLERGFRVHGTVRAGGAALAGAFVVAERVGGPPSSVSGFVHAPNTANDGGFELVVPPGAYRLLGFAKGHAPAVVDVAVQDGDQQVDPELRRFGTEGPPPGLPFRWADRRNVAIPIETAELPGAELVAWIEAIVGAPIAIEPDARATLASLEMNASFIGVPAGDALNLVAQLAALEFDPDAGAIRVPR